MSSAEITVGGRDIAYKTGMVAAAAVVLAALSLLFIDWLLRAETLPVRQVSFEGEFRNVSRWELEKAVLAHAHSNFLVLDLGLIKTDVEALPWVRRASVRREWPSGVHIAFSEQRFVARWRDAAWLNAYGELVDVGELQPSAGLPSLSGPEDSHRYVLQQYAGFVGILESAGLRISALVQTARRTWEMQLDNGVLVILGKEQPDYRLERFARVYRSALARHREAIKRVDLRYTNGFAVQWANTTGPGPASFPKAGDDRAKG